MRKYALFVCALFIGLIASHSAAAQLPIKITGSVVDSTNDSYLEYTSISAIRSSDSLLISFTRADEEGKFALSVPQSGDYMLLISHPEFATYLHDITVPNKDFDAGALALISKSLLLEEFVFTENRAIIIKGDTTEYSADSFKVREFANVDELLKRLPGLEIDNKGNITAHGEKVQRMLVDGDEFFSDDPAVLSKMLRASAVDKVQVFDGKTEDAQFTGVDDGERIKTINLKLKDNAKSGYFGKVELGGGLPGYWENQAMINSFKKKRKLSAFAIMSNTNKVGLGWDDAGKYGSGGGFQMSEEGGFSVESSGGEDNFSNYNGGFGGQGLPKTWNGGLHYGDKYGENGQHELTADYRINKNDLSTLVNGRSQYMLPDTQYVNVSKDDQFSSSMRNNINARGKIYIDSTSDIIIRAGASHVNNISNSLNSGYYADLNENKFNESSSSRATERNTKAGNMEINYRKKLKKTGRTFTAKLMGNVSEASSDGSFNSTNSYFGTIPDLIYNQRKEDNVNNSTFNAKFTYTEPLSEKLFLTTNVYTNLNNNKNRSLTYDKDGSGGEAINDIFSSDYNYRVWTNSGGADLRYNMSKYSIAVGANVAYTDFLQTDNALDTSRNYSYPNFFPSITFRNSERRSSNFYVRYDGATRQPTINQLQPLRVNTDPLNIRLGNPDLKQEFRHNLNFNYGKYELLKEQYFYTGGGLTYIDNAIGTEQNISPFGSTTRSVNVAGNFTSYLYGGYSKKVKAIKSRVSANLNGSYNRSISILNGVNTVTENYNIGPSFGIAYDKDSTIMVNFNLAPSYNANSTQNNSQNTNFLQMKTTFDGSYLFPGGIQVGTNVDWLVREKTTPMDIYNNVFIWNAYVSKSFLKDRSLVLKVTGNDILNQNIGFQYFTYNNTISETQYNNIRRYFMLSIGWNFTKSSALGKSADLNSSEETIEEADTDPDAYQLN